VRGARWGGEFIRLGNQQHLLLERAFVQGGRGLCPSAGGAGGSEQPQAGEEPVLDTDKARQRKAAFRNAMPDR
jgi:hypothetical protein